MSHTVEKIGGTSISDTENVVKNIFLSDNLNGNLYNRAFVVSAYSGMTNLLLEHKKSGKPGVYGLFSSAENSWAWHEALNDVSVAMIKKNAELFGLGANKEAADAFVVERIEGVRNCLIDLHRLCSYGQFRLDEHLKAVREMLAALGEAHSAYTTVLLLKEKGVDAVFVDLTGWRDDRVLTLDERIREAFDNIDLATTLPITTGYANCDLGMVEKYDRGYTEVTFAHIAAVTQADEAIIHKEFHLSSADPKLVGLEKVEKIGSTNYDVADQLSNMGMEAVHPSAAKTLRQAGISLRVKNTFDPTDPGTVFRDDFNPETPRAEIITGLTNIYALEVFEQDMVGVKGYDAHILHCLTRHSIRIISKCSNANTITHFVQATRKALKRAVADIEAKYDAASITMRKLAMVSVIGANLDVPGITATATTALAKSDVALLGLIQLTRHTDLQLMVSDDDFEKAVKALHASLIESSETVVKEVVREAA